MHRVAHLSIGLAAGMAFAGLAYAEPARSAEDAAASYRNVALERAARIVATLQVSDTNRAARVQEIIARQYEDLNRVHGARDAGIKAARDTAGTDRAAAESGVRAARDGAQAELGRLHADFLGKLSSELSAAQVDQVKDGMTYSVAPLTFGVYQQMYPALTNEQKQQIQAWLLEARETAMDAGTAEEKHAVFGKYKGRINNYLVKAGYDLKQGERNLKASRAPATNETSQ